MEENSLRRGKRKTKRQNKINIKVVIKKKKKRYRKDDSKKRIAKT